VKLRKFYVVTEEEIKEGKVTDVYFTRTVKILKSKGLDRVNVSMEISAHSIPRGWNWGVLVGVEELANLLEGIDVDCYCMEEGEIFTPEIPVALIKGEYGKFAIYETSILGLLSQSSGVATTAAHVKLAAQGKPVVNFGIRRMHPGISLSIERASIIGGCDGSSGILLEELGLKPVGTMPHALILIFENQAEAWKAFDEVLPKDIPRVALVDTYWDEKAEAILAAETLGEKLYAVRLDTPRSRRGKMVDIVREVRWELDSRGFKNVKIFVSGGLDDKKVKELSEAGADAFGVGTFITNAETVDFGMDIVAVEGEPRSKRGKLSGEKQVYRCPKCFGTVVTRWGDRSIVCKQCGVEMEALLKPLVIRGKIVRDKPDITEVRSRVLEKIEMIKDREIKVLYEV